ncbi:glycosyltransferase [Sphingobium sp. BHU LFT2]|uniref:glycosyltransferase n=1 Tax=Sphingobium sp. BHU LFT2 TaxID=2807634 RepID=UPI001BEC5E06|nr:glycosyltransferase [Sphingobium sp. BHU LFT2]
MKVSALCDFAFWEGRVGTAVRFSSLCHSLSKVCDLTVISTVTLANRYKSFAVGKPYEFLDRSVLQKVHEALPPGIIPGVANANQVSVRGIRELVISGGFDAVLTPYFNRRWMIEHLPADIVRIIDTHDCQSQRTRSFARHGLIPTFRMTPEEEGAELDKYDIVLAMSDEDFDEFSAISSSPVVTTPFRLPLHDLTGVRSFYAPGGENRELLFIAADSPVNQMTLAYLLRDVLPLVPGHVVLNVVGNVSMPKNFTENSNFTVVRHENIDDLVPIYARCALAVNPTFMGGGVKTKTLEALAFGVPSLNADEGARGMRHLIPDELIANDKETFAWRIGELLSDPEKRATLANEQTARVRTEDSESWLTIFRDLLHAIRSHKLEAFA